MAAAGEAAPDPQPDTAAHVFLSPEVVEIHLRNGVPVAAATAKLIWAINMAFERDDFV